MPEPVQNQIGTLFNIKAIFLNIGIPIIKIRRSHDRLIIMMGMPIPNAYPSKNDGIFILKHPADADSIGSIPGQFWYVYRHHKDNWMIIY